MTKKKTRGVFERPKGSNVWWIQYFADGKKKREKVGKKSDAINLYQQRKTEIRMGAKMPANLRHKGERLSGVIDRAIDWYTERRYKNLRTIKQQLETMRDGLGDHVVEELKAEHIDDWLSKTGKQRDWKPATANRYKSVLSRALQNALKSGRVRINTARLVESRRENNARVRWLKTDEEERLYAVMSPESKDMVNVARYSGMRQGEQFTLTWDEIDLERRRVYLRETKNGSDREIPMNNTVHEILTRLEKEKKDRWVFRSKHFDKRLKNPRKAFETAIEKAKVRDFKWHDLRHDFCSRLVMKGVGLRTVMELAGHKSITITTRYAHLAPEHNEAAVKVLDAA